jgi:hypothetical protein
MTTILSSSHSAPLSSVMICRNTVTTTVNMSFRDELFSLGACTDWLGSCYWLCLKGGGALIYPTVAGQACATGGRWGCCYCCVLLRSAAIKDSLGKVVGREQCSHCSLGRSLWLSLSYLFHGVAAASVVWGMRSLSIHQLAVAACWCRCCIVHFWALLVQVTASTPQTTGRLLAVRPDIAKFLTVITLCETSLSFVHLYPDCNMAKTHQFKYLLALWHPR